MPKILCIHHKGCADGFTAALIVKMYLAERGDECEFLPANYGDTPPDVTGKRVYIVDFSYPRETLLAMQEVAAHITVLDHHKTAQAALADIPFCTFNMKKSGAMLAWEHFFPSSFIVPDLVKYVQDRDLWEWKLPRSAEYSAGLRLQPMEFDVWEKLMDNTHTEAVRREGATVLAYQKLQVAHAVSHDVERVCIGGWMVPCINATHLISEIGNEMAKDRPFVALYFDTADARVYSLRSAENGVDVGEIAKQYGGGGHAHAAGFKTAKPGNEKLHAMFRKCTKAELLETQSFTNGEERV